MDRTRMLVSVVLLMSSLITSAMAQWTQANGAAGSQVSALAFKPPQLPETPSLLFAATADGGILRSADSGGTWKSMNEGLSNKSVRALACIRQNLFAGTAGGGVFRSTDDGAHWTPINDGLSNPDIWILAGRGDTLFAGTSAGGVFVVFAEADRWVERSVEPGAGIVQSIAFDQSATIGGPPGLFAGTSDGKIYRSTDDGSSWAAMGVGLTSVEVRAIASSQSNDGSGRSILLAGTSDGLFQSNNHGIGWTRIETGLTTISIRSLEAVGSYILVGADSGQIAFSTDVGTTWTITNDGLPASYNVTSLLLSPPAGWRDIPAIFAGTSGGGIYRANGTGTDWIQKLNSPFISSLAFKDSILFAGTSLGKAYRSTNGGLAWTDISSGLPAAAFNVFTHEGKRLFAGTNHGIFQSDNDGGNWCDITNGMTNTNVTAIVFTGSVLYAGTAGGGVFRTIDSGRSWTAVNRGLGSNTVTCLASAGSQVFAGTSTTGTFMSPDSGRTWIPLGPQAGSVYALAACDSFVFAGLINSGILRYSNKGGSGIRADAGLTNPYVLALAAGHEPDNHSGRSLFAGTQGGGIFRSTDSGQSWSPLGPPGTSIAALALFPDANVDDLRNVFAGVLGSGVCSLTTSTLSWNPLQTPLQGKSVSSLSVRKGYLFAGTSGYGVFMSGDGGSTWRACGPANTHVSAIVAGSDSIHGGISRLLAATSDSGLYITDNDGRTWTPSGIEERNLSAIVLTDNPGTTNILNLFAGTPSGVIAYSGDGTDWQHAWSRELYGVSVYGLMSVPTADPSSAPLLYAATSAGIYRSNNNGEDWLAVNQGLTTPYVYGMAALPGSRGNGIDRLAAATYGGGVFTSSDSGSTWKSSNAGLGNLYVYSLLTWRGSMFAGTYNGVYCSTNAGGQWTNVSEGLSSPFVFSLAATDSQLFAGIYRGGIWRRPLAEILSSVSCADNREPSSIRLEQSFPNPFNDATTIRYTLGTRAHVLLTVYNILGQTVAVLVDGESTQGNHEVPFAGNDLATGVYFYTLRTGHTTLTRQCILLR